MSMLMFMLDQSKLEKLGKIRALGVNPYPYTFDQTHHADEIAARFDELSGKTVSVAGRILRMRKMGKLHFIDLLDGSGKLQIMVKEDAAQKSDIDVLKLLDLGDIIGVKGSVIKTRAGEVSVELGSLTLLSKSLRTMPEKFHGLSDVESRYRQRYLDLIVNPEARKIFRTRTAVISYIRDFLNARKYLEVETPIIQPQYGGANAQPFKTHHNFLGTDMYLRIAPELYLKRLIIGGFERVYEFAKNFRNESVDAKHNPEFTMLEFYEAYGDYNTLMNLTEEMLGGLAKKLYGGYEVTYQGSKISFKPPFRRISLVDEIKKKSGIDISELTDESAAKVAKDEKLETSIRNAYHVADALFDKYVQDEITDPAFVIDYPGYMCALTKDKRGNPKLSERFELFMAGKEFGNCYSELTDPIEQRRKFEEQAMEKKKGDTEAPPSDEDFLEAIEYGMPPTAGMGIGIDRLVMLFADVPSLKEVILFPTVKPEQRQGEPSDEA
ncbi:Aspartate--tRNA(Asp/Asn) ligase [uncultured archaeon]|nr:Aspartate--tRNA(Asp/Asn) ligase [uncultured archaeon]